MSCFINSRTYSKLRLFHTRNYRNYSLCWVFCLLLPHVFVLAESSFLRGLPHHGKVPITSKTSADIHWWLQFLPCYNGVSVIPPPTYSANVLVTDACITGAGGHFQEQCFHVTFLNNILDNADYNINIKELLAITVTLHLWGCQLTGR